MSGIDIHYPIAGVIVFWGAVAFLKCFDYLASQSVKRLLEQAAHLKGD